MRNAFLTILFLAMSLASFTARAGNEHEHLQYLPRYEDIQKAMHGKLGTLPARSLIGNQALLIQQLFGDEVARRLLPNEVPLHLPNGKINGAPVVNHLQTLVNESTLDGLCEKIAKLSPTPTTSTEVMKSFLELNVLHADDLNGYIATSGIRNTLFASHPEVFQASVKNYLESVKKSETIKTVFSVPEFMMKKETLAPLQKMFSEKGLQTQFFLSLPRRIFTDPKVAIGDQMASYHQSVEEGVLSGIDISGSIRENAEPVKNAEKIHLQTKERLKYVMDQSRLNKTAIRIHSFEATNAGTFYDALWDALTECKVEGCLPPLLRIGHIQELKAADIEKLSQLKNSMPIVFEANIESNLKVQSSELKKLSSTIESLHQKGFRVVLGSDGRGILGEGSTFESTLRELKKSGMQEASLKTLIKDAHLPIRGTRIDKKQLLNWQMERLEVQNKLFGVENHASSCPINTLSVLRAAFKRKSFTH